MKDLFTKHKLLAPLLLGLFLVATIASQSPAPSAARTFFTSSLPFFEDTIAFIGIADVAEWVNDAFVAIPSTQTASVVGSTTGVIFSDNFESSLSWEKVGLIKWYVGWYKKSPRNGTHSARLRGKGAMTKNISLIGYENITVSFAMGAHSLDNDNEYVHAGYYNGTEWVEFARIANNSTNENKSLNTYSVQLPASVNNLETFALGFRITASGSGDYAYVDDVVVTGTESGQVTPTPTPKPTPTPEPEPNKAPTATIQVTPTAITKGASATLSWSSTNATACTGAGFVTGNTITGSVSVIPSQTTSYSITCTGAVGSVSQNVTLTVNPVVEPPQPTPTPTRTPTPGSSSNLMQGLVTDKLPRPMTALSRPALGQTVIDPEFGTRITRVTDAAAQFDSNVAKPAYSTIPAWNADESLLILYVTDGPREGHYLFNGKTYAFIKELDIAPTDIEHFYWSSTDPDILYYPYAWEMSGESLRQLIKYHVSTGKKEIVYSIPNAGMPSAWRVDVGGDPTYSSWDNDLFGFRRRADNSDTGFTYRVSTNVESTRLSGDAPQIAPSGSYYLFNGKVYDAKTNAILRTLKVPPFEHGDMTLLANGQDVWASVQFDGYEGTLVTENLSTGEVKTVIGPSSGYPYPPTGTHISGHAFKAPGFVAISATGDPAGRELLDQELLLVDLNTGTVGRVAHHRSRGSDGPNGYWSEPHVNISPSGTRMIFSSDWGSGGVVDTYVVELPSYVR